MMSCLLWQMGIVPSLLQERSHIPGKHSHVVPSVSHSVVWVLSSGKASTSPISMPYCFGCDCQGDGFGEAP